MTTEINNRVQQQQQLQVSITNATMGKKLYFWPKNVNNLFVYFRKFSFELVVNTVNISTV